jgi:hypothetical protein
MKFKHSEFFPVLIVAVLFLSWGLPCSAFSDLNEQFRKQLLSQRNKSISAETLEEVLQLEENCLKLLKDHNSPTEKGMIYATITLIYSRHGYGSSNDGKYKLTKSIEFGKKALKYPIPDVLLKCRVYSDLAGAIFIKAKEDPNENFIESRRRAVDIALKGLKIALDNKAPKERLEPPEMIVVPNIISNNNNPAYQKAMEKYKKQLAEWEQFRYLNKLYLHRSALSSQCITLYSEEPYDVQEFKKYAQKILVGYDDVVNELVEKIEKRILTLSELYQKAKSQK